jgi:hypothetical protein
MRLGAQSTQPRATTAPNRREHLKEHRQEATMAKLERFATSVTCPQCALNGSATWEEDESGNLNTTIKSASHGFIIGPGTEIYCDDCGVKATFGRTLSRSEMMTCRHELEHRRRQPSNGGAAN